MILRFEDNEIDLARAELRRAGENVAIEPRAFDLLCLLVSNRDRLVSREEIVSEVWDGRHISDAAISTCIKSVRKAINDDGDLQRLIKTVRGRGFRFAGEATEGVPERQVFAETADAQPTTDANEEAGKPSIVVLPFESFETDQGRQVLAEAIPHELIQGLAKLRWVRVIARGTAFRFKGPDLDLAMIGAKLGVRYALTGTILQFQDIVSMTVELTHCADGQIVWADRFEDRVDRFLSIRREILDQIASSLEIYITQREASNAARSSAERLDAWAEYHLGLRYLFLFTKNNNASARSCFERAIEKDPAFARAHAGLSFARFQDAFVGYTPDHSVAVDDARRHAERGVELDPLDPFANLNLGRSFWLQGAPGAGLGWLERSISLSPNFAQGHYSRAFAEAMQGRSAAALTHASAAIDLSPLDPLLYGMRGVRAFALLRGGDPEAAAKEAVAAVHAPGAHHLIDMIAAAAFALAGDVDSAQFYGSQARKRAADTGMEQFFTAFPFVEPEFRHNVRRGLALAGFD
ncbi:MAG: winged helix-turn-helix domain-containing protein [Pseudomonadota bacterium]